MTDRRTDEQTDRPT